MGSVVSFTYASFVVKGRDGRGWNYFKIFQFIIMQVTVYDYDLWLHGTKKEHGIFCFQTNICQQTNSWIYQMPSCPRNCPYSCGKHFVDPKQYIFLDVLNVKLSGIRQTASCDSASS